MLAASFRLYTRQAFLHVFLNSAIANMISIGIRFCGHDLSYQPPPERLEQLKAIQCDPQEQVVKDLAIVMLTPGVATNLVEVRVLLQHTKNIISELEGNYEISLRLLATFEKLSEGY
jgi:hypothetical protein